MAALEGLVTGLKVKHEGAQVLGHRDLPNVQKTCPNFDVRAWWAIVG
jgi:N-acetylmuramoyl-L-alanine amidase